MGFVVAALTAAAPVRAQEVTADQLFEKGRALLQEQGADLAKACDYLAESDRLAPAVGTLGLLATCHERRNMIASAWREYLEVVERAARTSDPRGAFAKQRAEELEPRVPKLVLTVDRPAPGLGIERDKQPVAASLWGQDMAVDPGPVEIVARAPGRRELRMRVVARESSRTYLQVPELLHEEPAAIARRPAPAEPPVRLEPNPLRVPLVLGAGAVGVAGAIVGATFGSSAAAKNDASEQIHDTCGPVPESCARGRALREEAQRDATISTIGFGAGILGVGAVVLAFAITPPKPVRAPSSGFWLAPGAGPGGAATHVGWKF